jgi:tubulin polyglutamylase TTLL1
MVQSNNFKFKWRSDLDKATIINNFEKRGWTKHNAEDDWNIYWALPYSCRVKYFGLDASQRLQENQVINHFPNHDELTKKDTMVKNIKRYRKDLEKEKDPLAEKDEHGRYVHMDIIPQTYILPGDYRIFEDEFRRMPNSTWIVKPSSNAQGKGIFLVNKLAQLRKFSTESRV